MWGNVLHHFVQSFIKKQTNKKNYFEKSGHCVKITGPKIDLLTFFFNFFRINLFSQESVPLGKKERWAF